MATTVTAKRKAKKKSVMKRIRLTERRTVINRKRKGSLRAQVKKFRRALDSGDAAQVQELLKPTLSVLDRAARKGILHRNTAARTKSRLLQRYNSLQEKTQPAA
jgi:small subunit ribosomal protein S20